MAYCRHGLCNSLFLYDDLDQYKARTDQALQGEKEEILLSEIHPKKWTEWDLSTTLIFGAAHRSLGNGAPSGDYEFERRVR